jgi:hypothetical protein
MYQLNYDNTTGKVSGIKRNKDSASLPLAEGNSDYQAFLEWNAKQAVPLDIVTVNQTIKDAYEAEKAAREAAQAAKAKAIIDNLPSWAQVEAAIDAADTLPKLRAIVKKLARVEYWEVKNKAD